MSIQTGQKAIPLVNQEAGTIADAIFFRIICEYGTPKACNM